MKAYRWLLLAGMALVAVAQVAAEPVTLPAGTILHLRNDTPVSSEYSAPGDPIRATVVQPFLYASRELIPMGSVLTGTLQHVKKPGRIRGRGELRLVFESIKLPNGEKYSVQAVVRALDNPDMGVEVTDEGTLHSSSSRKKDAMWLGAGAGTGAIIGGVAGGPAGAAIGAGIGSGALLVRRGRHVYLEAGSEFQVEFTTPLALETRSRAR